MLPMLNVLWGGNIIESWDYNINIFGDFSLFLFSVKKNHWLHMPIAQALKMAETIKVNIVCLTSESPMNVVTIFSKQNKNLAAGRL